MFKTLHQSEEEEEAARSGALINRDIECLLDKVRPVL